MPPTCLLPGIDDAVAQLGLRAEEIAFLLEAEVEACHRARGQTVRAHVHLDVAAPSITVVEVPPFGSFARERPIAQPLHPQPQAFLERVEAYRRAKSGRTGWDIALATCVTIEPEYSLVEVSEPRERAGALAVLPHARLAMADRAAWSKGVSRHVALRPAAGEARDTAAPWQALKPAWLASRSDSLFLRLMVRQFYGLEVRAELYIGIGMVVLDEHADLGTFVGSGGEHQRALQTLTGCEQIVVVREPGALSDVTRLRYALRQLTPVKRFGLIAPARAGSPWTIVVPPELLKRVLGVRGVRLMFISRLARVPVVVRVRSQV